MEPYQGSWAADDLALGVVLRAVAWALEDALVLQHIAYYQPRIQEKSCVKTRWTSGVTVIAQ